MGLKNVLKVCMSRLNVTGTLAGRVCVAQAVRRQPRPRFCRATEGRPGELPAAHRVAPGPLQRQDFLPLFDRGQHHQPRDFKVISAVTV